MAQGYNINIKGLKELQDKMAKMPEVLEKRVNGIIEDVAKVFVRNAKKDAPVDMGVLRNSITYYKNGKLSFTIVSGAKYSPYLEFGTITKVSVPTELAAYAAQFKGKGLRANGGIYPHPYFFLQTPIAKKQAETDIKQLLGDIKL